MSDDTDPFVHVLAGGEKWNICFSRIAKQVLGLALTMATALLSGAFVFAWQSNAKLETIGKHLDDIDGRLDRMDARITAAGSDKFTNKQGDEQLRRIERLEDKVDGR